MFANEGAVAASNRLTSNGKSPHNHPVIVEFGLSVEAGGLLKTTLGGYRHKPAAALFRVTHDPAG